MKEYPSIYITKGISLRKKTDEDWEKELKKSNITYNREQTMESYKKFTNSWEKTAADYIIGAYHHAYFMDREDAIGSIIDNMGGMDEAGCYMYAALFKVPTGVSYPESCAIEDYEFYQFNSTTRQYEPLTDNDLLKVFIDFFQLNYVK